MLALLKQIELFALRVILGRATENENWISSWARRKVIKSRKATYWLVKDAPLKRLQIQNVNVSHKLRNSFLIVALNCLILMWAGENLIRPVFVNFCPILFSFITIKYSKSTNNKQEIYRL